MACLRCNLLSYKCYPWGAGDETRELVPPSPTFCISSGTQIRAMQSTHFLFKDHWELPPLPLPLGWSYFWRKFFWTHVMLYHTVIGPQIQNFTLKCCFLTWCKASWKYDCYHKWANFQQQILIFKVSVNFWKWKLCQFLGLELIKIYLIGSNVSIFENRKKW